MLYARDKVMTYALVVDDLNDSGESSSVGSGTEESNAANLHQFPRACRDVCVAHLAECLKTFYLHSQYRSVEQCRWGEVCIPAICVED